MIKSKKCFDQCKSGFVVCGIYFDCQMNAHNDLLQLKCAMNFVGQRSAKWFANGCAAGHHELPVRYRHRWKIKFQQSLSVF